MNSARYEGPFRIIGPPGTGKTRWMRSQVRAINEHDKVLSRPSNMILCSLTKTAAGEIIRERDGEDRLPISRSSVGTLHSHCYRALGKREIAEAHISEWNEDHSEYTIGSGTTPDVDDPGSEWNPKSDGDDLYHRYCLYREKMVARSNWNTEVKRFAEDWEDWKRNTDRIDFTDMIELCYRDFDYAPGRPRQIMVDEGQDLSSLEYQLIRKWGGQAQAEFIAGDPWQALYVWRGARPELFFDPDVPKDHMKTLSQSYRIPAAIHRVAMRWATNLSDHRNITYKPKEEEGHVYKSNATWRYPEPAIRSALKELEKGHSVMMMASCSFQLQNILAHLRAQGIPFANPWRPKRGDWNPIRAATKGSSTKRIADFLQCDWQMDVTLKPWTLAQFGNWTELLQAKKVFRHGMKAAIKFETEVSPNEFVSAHDLARFFEDHQHDELTALINESESHSPSSTRDLLEWLQSNMLESKLNKVTFAVNTAKRVGPQALTKTPKLYVGTIHSFKGAEADVVYVFPDLSSSGAREWIAGGKNRDNVVRMFYVALTRAKKRLIVCRPMGNSPVNVLH